MDFFYSQVLFSGNICVSFHWNFCCWLAWQSEVIEIFLSKKVKSFHFQPHFEVIHLQFNEFESGNTSTHLLKLKQTTEYILSPVAAAERYSHQVAPRSLRLALGAFLNDFVQKTRGLFAFLLYEINKYMYA